MEVREIGEKEQAAMDRLECARAAYNKFMEDLPIDVRDRVRKGIVLAAVVGDAEEEVNFEGDY